MKNTFTIQSLETIDEVAAAFLKQYNNHRIIAFYGEMGAGKTTFIKALCKAMKVEDTVNSPSFAIINEYHTDADEVIFHFDFYRLKRLEEAYDLGYEDYVYSGNYCFIEWPSKIEELLPPLRLDVTITEETDGTRLLTIDEVKE
jgi:tRNA threonylcarbamoyladenosine biosynthesis protein TsaE